MGQPSASTNEARLAKLDLSEAERPKIDPDFDEVTEGEEQTIKERLKSKWARLEAVAGFSFDVFEKVDG
jgi:type I restriction enzyme R subunit